MMKLGPGSYGEDKSWFLNSLGSEVRKRKKAKPKLESQAKLASTHARTEWTQQGSQRSRDAERRLRRKREKEGNEEDDEGDDEKGSLNVHQVLLFLLFTFTIYFFPILYYISFNGTANFQRFKKNWMEIIIIIIIILLLLIYCNERKAHQDLWFWFHNRVSIIIYIFI